MKKILSLFAVAGAMVAMVGCDDKKPTTAAAAATTKSTTTTTSSSTDTKPATTPAK
jgi:hypothetical protein